MVAKIHIKVDYSALTKELIDQGKLIEAGWIGLRGGAIDSNASVMQLQDMRMAFFAGAQHLYASIMIGLDPDKEPTTADMKRMQQIHDELENFSDELMTRLARRKQ